MCGGGSKTPDMPATPDPTPIPQPSQSSPGVSTTEGQRVNKVQQLKKGMFSTIKTSPQGTTGKDSDFRRRKKAPAASQQAEFDTGENKQLGA